MLNFCVLPINHFYSQVEENEIRDIFARYGDVKEVRIMTYRGGICKG